MISVFVALSQIQLYTVKQRSQCITRGVPLYAPAVAGTHCAYSWRDGQAELTWVAGHIPRWFIRLPTIHRGSFTPGT